MWKAQRERRSYGTRTVCVEMPAACPAAVWPAGGVAGIVWAGHGDGAFGGRTGAFAPGVRDCRWHGQAGCIRERPAFHLRLAGRRDAVPDVPSGCGGALPMPGGTGCPPSRKAGVDAALPGRAEGGGRAHRARPGGLQAAAFLLSFRHPRGIPVSEGAPGSLPGVLYARSGAGIPVPAGLLRLAGDSEVFVHDFRQRGFEIPAEPVVLFGFAGRTSDDGIAGPAAPLPGAPAVCGRGEQLCRPAQYGPHAGNPGSLPAQRQPVAAQALFRRAAIPLCLGALFRAAAQKRGRDSLPGDLCPAGKQAEPKAQPPV